MQKLLEQFYNHPLLAKIKELDKLNLDTRLSLEESVKISINYNSSQIIEQKNLIEEIANELKPWRKGPFDIDGLFIDSEWQSFMKFDILRPYMSDLSGQVIADVGCNNGYYMFKMLDFKPDQIIGFDPSIRCALQFHFINALAKTKLKFELLGVEDLPNYGVKFDTIFCLGVIYHRSDPIKMLKQLKAALKPGGVVFLDTMYIEGEGEIALIPRKTYSKISNIYFVVTILGLRNWCERAGFSSFEVLAKSQTTECEQRKTAWSNGYSLGDFLDKNDASLTCEGYPAPRRVYVKIKA